MLRICKCAPTHCSCHEVMSNSLGHHDCAAHQVLCAWNFEEYQSRLPLPAPWIFLNPEMSPYLLHSPALAGGFLLSPSSPAGPLYILRLVINSLWVHVQQNAQKYKQICNKAHRECVRVDIHVDQMYYSSRNLIYQSNSTSQSPHPQTITIWKKDLESASPFPPKYAQPISLPLRLRKKPKRIQNPSVLSNASLTSSCSSHKSCWWQ